MAKTNRSSSTKKAGKANGSIISPAQRDALLRAMKNAGRQSSEQREKEQAEQATRRERDALEHTVSNLREALKLLQQANEAIYVIADGSIDDVHGLDGQALAKFVNLAINEIGRDIEQSLLNLGVLPKDCFTWFCDGEIAPVTFPQPPAKRQTAEARHV